MGVPYSMSNAGKQVSYDIADISLAERGRFRMQWAGKEMPVLDLLEERYRRERPFEGVRMAAAMHVTSETANLMRILLAGGAEIALCASNPLSTQDDIAAALVTYYEMPVYAIKGETTRQYNEHINAALDTGPHLTMDDGMDLVAMLHTQRQQPSGQCRRRHRRDDYRCYPPQSDGCPGQAGLPRYRRQRRHDQALL